MTSISDGNSKKDLSTETAFFRLYPLFTFRFMHERQTIVDLFLIPVASAAVYHHDPNSVRT